MGTPITLDHIPDEHLRGIGLVALSWAFLEGAMERVIWRAARLTDRQGAALTTHMSVPQKLQAMCTMVNLEFPGSGPDLRLPKMSEYIRKDLSTLRNDIVHNRIIKFPDVDDALRLTYKARGTYKAGANPIRLSEYEETSQKILATATELRQVISDLYNLIREKDGAPPP